MLVDVEQIGTVYDTLMGKAEATLVEQYDSGRIKADGLASALAAVMSMAMQTSVQVVQNQPRVDAEVLASKVQGFVALANSQKDVELKDAQIVAQQSETAIKETQSTADAELKASQKLLIDAQKSTEGAKLTLTNRQATAYDDQRKVKKAEVYGNTVGMVFASGTTVDAGRWTELNGYISAI